MSACYYATHWVVIRLINCPVQIVKEIEAQRGSVTCLRSHSYQVAELRFETQLLGSKAKPCLLFTHVLMVVTQPFSRWGSLNSETVLVSVALSLGASCHLSSGHYHSFILELL